MNSTNPRAKERTIECKPLEWTECTSPREDGPHEPNGDYEAVTILGVIDVSFDGAEDMAATPFVAWVGDDNLGHFPSADEAKAFVQAHYEARIRSALDPAVSGEAEAGWAVKAIEDAQATLAEYIIPDSGISEMECVNRLLSILDNQTLVRAQRAYEPSPVPKGESERDGVQP